jgi:hypothetical protein
MAIMKHILRTMVFSTRHAYERTSVDLTCATFIPEAILRCEVRIVCLVRNSVSLIHLVIDHGVEVEGTQVQERHTRTDTALLRWRLCRAPSIERHLTTNPPQTFAILQFRIMSIVLLLKDRSLWRNALSSLRPDAAVSLPFPRL